MDQFYLVVKESHSFFRWLILALAVLVVINFLLGSVSKNKYNRVENLMTLFYTICLDIQFLVGLLLYFALSPVTKGFMEGNSSMSDPNTRFYAVEHPAMMLLAIVCAHVGRVVSQKATTDLSKFRRGLIWYSLSLILIVARMPW